MREFEPERTRALTPLRTDLDPAEVRSVAVPALTLLNGSAVIALDLTPEVRALLLRRMTSRRCWPAPLPVRPDHPPLLDQRGRRGRYGGPQAHIGRGRS